MNTHNLLNWSEEYEANEDIRYNHVLAVSPIGKFSIEWKGWKESDEMSIYLDGHYIDCADTLEEAKEVVDMYLFSKTDQLNELFTKRRFEDMKNEQILKDAQRYQYLRQQHWFSGSMCVVLNPKESIKLGSVTVSGNRLDSVIDVERASHELSS